MWSSVSSRIGQQAAREPRAGARHQAWIAAVGAGVLSLSALATPLCATEQASGRFESRGFWFEVAGAYAFPARVGMDDEPGIRVAISNARFATDFLNLFWDRRQLIDHQFVDEQTAVAYLDFTSQGAFLGATYFLESGNNCGFCRDADSKSTVKRSGDRLAGQVTVRSEERKYDVTLDVPIAPALPGKEIAKDGGDAGRAYLAYHAALDAGDGAAVQRLLSAEAKESFEEVQREGGNALASLDKDHPAQVRILRAFQRDEWTILLLAGEESWGKLHGEARMKREDGVWHFWDELFAFGDFPKGLEP